MEVSFSLAKRSLVKCVLFIFRWSIEATSSTEQFKELMVCLNVQPYKTGDLKNGMLNFWRSMKLHLELEGTGL